MGDSSQSGKVVILAVLAMLLVGSSSFVALKPLWGAGAIASHLRQQVEPLPRPQVGPRLPGSVSRAVQRDLSQRVSILQQQIEIKSYRTQMWRDGCLGLPAPGEICNQALVQGWRVEASNGDGIWVYRTDHNGRNVRLDQSESTPSDTPSAQATPSPQVLHAVAQAARDRFLGSVRIISFEASDWTDGCLGLALEGEVCTQEVVSGWRVTIENSIRQQWVYRTDSTGERVRLDVSASNQSRGL